MPLNLKDEIDLVRKACDENNEDRQKYKNKLWEYISGTYLGLLIRNAKWFEYTTGRLPVDPEDTCNDFIQEVVEKDKLCTWEFLNLRSSLKRMLITYLIDLMRTYCEIKYKRDSLGRKVRDENGSYIIDKISIKKPNLRNCKTLFIPTEERDIENPEIYKGMNIFETEPVAVDEKMLETIKEKQGKALLELQKLSPRDADIIYRESRGISRKEIATELEIAPSGINTTVRRAYKKYAVIYHRTLKYQGIDTKISEDGLRKVLIDFTKAKKNDNMG